jgi:hypothetical protein
VTIDLPATPRPIAIAAGEASACVLRADRTVACFGAWSAGQLGDGATSRSDVPVLVRGLP